LEDDIEMDLKEIGSESVDWIQLPQDMVHWRALVNTVITFGLKTGNFLSSRVTINQLLKKDPATWS
jgi:hypothetical protein